MPEPLNLDKIAKEMNTYEYSSVRTVYEGYSSHFNNVVSSCNEKVVNWAFTLNTGGLFGLITYMSAIKKFNFLLLISTTLFTIGMMSIILSIFLEMNRFVLKGRSLDHQYKKFENNELKGLDFINKAPKKNPCLDSIVPILEKFSYFLFFLGLFFGLCGLYINLTN